MVYELVDTTKAERLFEGMEDSMIRSCLQNVMGKVFVTDPEHPNSAMAYLASFAFFAGKPDRALVLHKPKGFINMIAPDEAWAKLIKECYPGAETYDRYAIRKDTVFDRKHLELLVDALPEGCEIRRIDADLYDRCLQSAQFEDCVMHFGSKERYLKDGRGFAVLKNGTIVSAASSFTVYREGIEIEIDTVEAERRKGLASAVAARLILDCLDAGLYPSWDAANLESVHLAEKLGYQFSHAYRSHFVGAAYDAAIDSPV
jgi:GNAT superfamily N-acetyltransferase